MSKIEVGQVWKFKDEDSTDLYTVIHTAMFHCKFYGLLNLTSGELCWLSPNIEEAIDADDMKLVSKKIKGIK